MSAISRILLPVDFSPHGVGAARYAGALADHFKAELTVLNVIETFHWIPASAWEYSAEFQAEAVQALPDQRKRELESYCKDEFGNLNVKHVIATGNPAELIVQQAQKDASDLIVMPTRGCGRFRRFLLGSVTSKVLHDATCAVWTGVHMEETSHDEWKAIRNVVCAIDKGPESPQVLKWAADFAAEFAARLTIVHAIPPITPAAHGYFDPDWWKTLATQAREDVSGIKLAAGVHGGNILIEEGQPAEAVTRVAKQLDADLLVIGRNPVQTLLGRLLENAYSIIRESPCPVVSV
jgi:nucleotide-binding universal stress UspA family protein